VNLPKPISIVGGGLAGLMLGIGLRQREIPAVIWEAGRYPRHRVCGEFISGRGQRVLERLGLRDSLAQAGASMARTGVFYFGRTGSPVRPLLEPALCLSRFRADALLAEHFTGLGGEMKTSAKWTEKDFGEGVVRATGRRLEPATDQRLWLGLKVHARNVALLADLEMHRVQDAYVGMTRLDGDEVNICGLFRRTKKADQRAFSWRQTLQGDAESLLHERLASADFIEESFCSVAGFTLKPKRASQRDDCAIGDALTMTPPVTGNGMSMAFEAAELAITPLAEYSRGKLSWGQARQAIALACDSAFARRLHWARWLQWLMFTPTLQGPLLRRALKSDWLWNFLFSRTR